MIQKIKLRKFTETVQIAEGGTEILFVNKYKDIRSAPIYSYGQFAEYAKNDKRIGWLYADEISFEVNND